MSKKTMKILTTIATILLIISMGTSIVAATSVGGMELSPNTANTGDITTIGNKVMGIIQVVGTIAVIAAVIILMILGIKYMMGSAEEKAEYKKTMIPYIIGAVLLFAATTIANAIYTFASGMNSAS